MSTEQLVNLLVGPDWQVYNERHEYGALSATLGATILALKIAANIKPEQIEEVIEDIEMLRNINHQQMMDHLVALSNNQGAFFP